MRNKFRLPLTAAVFGCVLATNPALADNVKGAWLSPGNDNWPLVALHAILTPDGRVLTYGSNAAGNGTGLFFYDVWDPEEGLSGGHVTLQNTALTEIFCSYAVILPDKGDILILGGDIWDGTKVLSKGNKTSSIYKTSNSSLSRANDMQLPRWYATATPLMNGELYIQGGKNGEAFAEIRNLAGQFRRLTGVPTDSYNFWYPRNFLAPDGRVFGYDATGKMYFVTTTGNGSLNTVGQLGSSNSAKYSTAAMFQPGRILQVSTRNKNAVVIDINGSQPVVTPTGSLSAMRAWASATVLPDGQVVVTGGSGVPNTLTDVANKAEIWNPNTGKWQLGAAGSRPRLYHSFALLLPDASVLIGGGGASTDAPINNFRSEIYYPPYLYKASGGFASRPTIVSSPNILAPGLDFSMQVGGSGIVDRVTLLQTGAATHGVNVQQRFVEMPFARNGNTLSVQMHDKATDVPPGYYLLFVINDSGVPSVGKIVRINLTSSGGDPPNPGNGLLGKYFNNTALSGNPVLQRVESVDFNWGNGSPGPGVNANRFSARWTGSVEASATGIFQFETASNDGVRLWINGNLVINNWTAHATIKNDSAVVGLTGGTRYPVTLEYYDKGGAAVARLRWKEPGKSGFAAIPASRLDSN